MTALTIAGFAILGLAVGSFLNVCMDRLPKEESVLLRPSHCEACNRRLKPRDLFPLLSYIWLRGRCRYCGARIPVRLPVVELATGAIFALLAWHYGLGPQLVMALVYACFFEVIFVIDLEHRLVLYVVVFPAMALAFIFSFFWGGFGEYWPELGVTSALLGGAVGFAFMLVPFLLARLRYGSEGMGEGDVLLAGLIGLATGFPLAIVALIIGILCGGVVAVLLMLLGLKRRKDPIPFSPFLAAAAMLTLVWGVPILEWYYGLL